MTVILTPPTTVGLSLAKPKTPFDHFAQTGENVSTLVSVTKGHTSDDDHLGPLDAEMKLVGGATIATLSAKLRSGRWVALPEALGLASWFGSMALTPFMLHKLIEAKTGVDLGQTYITPEHRRTRMYRDPDYMPLHLLPDKEIHHIARKMGIPTDHPHYRELTEDKIREVARQGQTSWMLLAGPATPILTALICSTAQHPLAAGLTRLQSSGLQLAHNTLRVVNPDAADRVLSQWLKHFSGPVIDQWMTKWTDRLPHSWQLAAKGAENATQPQLVNQLKTLTPEALEQVTHKLTEDQLGLERLHQLLATKSTQHKGAANVQILFRQAEQKLAYARHSVQRQLQLLEQVKTGDANRISHWMDGHRLNRLEHLIRQGQMNWLTELLGPDHARQAVTLLAKKDLSGLENLVGAPAGTLLRNAWQQTARQAGWRNRYLVGLGGMTAIAAVALVALGVGKKATPDSLMWNDGPFKPQPGPTRLQEGQPV